MLGIEQQIKRAKKESPQERYARIDIDLADPEYIGKNIEVKITGDYLSRISYNGTATGCYFKFDSKHSSILYASEFKKRKTPFTEFKKIYLTNPVAQTGKHFILLVGSWYNGEIEPTPGITVGELDKDGSNLDPVTSQRFLYELTKHTVDLAALEVLQTATETSLDAILAKIIVAPATETSVAGIRTATEPGTGVSEELIAVGSGSADTFPSQTLVRGCIVVVNNMGTNTWIDITIGGHAVRCTAVGEGIPWIPISNGNQISVIGDNAADDGKVAYIGV